ncbi:MAG: hypothetical protein AAF429_01585 [Pseudomonadota bacterium]
MQSVTVSYGSFSLTVDGYEDPFKVIHEITELYAKMAAQYPDFGAEPMKTHTTNPEPVAAPPAPQAATDQPLMTQPLTPASDDSAQPAPIADTPKPLHPDEFALGQDTTAEIEPLRLNSPIPRYRRIDMSQIRAASEPLTTDDLEKVEPIIRRFPINGEN